MKRFMYRTRRVRATMRAKWMAYRLDVAGKKLESNDHIPASLKDMWESYLLFTKLEF